MRVKALQVGLLILWAAALCPATDGETLDSLKTQAQQEQHPRLYAEVVRRQVEVANDLYTTGDVEKAEDVIKEIIAFTGKCVDAARDFKNPKKLKETELTLYKAGRRLEEVRRSLNFDDQPVVQGAVEKIEKARRELLNLMFRKKKPAEQAAPPEAAKG
jgi:hypothetical protein